MLAASACYVVYTAIDWRGLSTSIATCIITALSTIGASRQKQFLRFMGAVIGGIFFGMGAQIFVLPYLNSIVGFTLLFVVVTGIAAWIANVYSATVLSWCAACSRFLSDQFARVRHPDFLIDRARSSIRCAIGPVFNVADIRSPLDKRRAQPSSDVVLCHVGNVRRTDRATSQG